jgi:hypothetical protein
MSYIADDWRGVGEPLNETESISPYPDPQRYPYLSLITHSFGQLLCCLSVIVM